MCAERLFQDEQFINAERSMSWYNNKTCKRYSTFVVFFPARIQMESVFPTETTAQFLYSIWAGIVDFTQKHSPFL